MKKEFLLLSVLISSAILVYLIYPIYNLTELDEQNISKSDKKEKPQSNQFSFNKDNIELTFDIVRLDKNGDVVIAGKTIPNIKVDILDGNETLASVFSDSNGDWVWISDTPLTEGIKRFNLKHFNGEDEFFSEQNIIILREKNHYSSKILKFSKNSTIEIINNNEKILGLTLDIVEHLDNNSLTLTGRTKPNSTVSLFFSNNFIEDSQSDKNGNWKMELENFKLKDNDLMITTEIEGQKIKLKTRIFDEKIDPNFILEKEITVKDGNSLWRIARKTLGGGIYYSEIYKNNIKEIENPDLIFPGQVFNIPNLKNN
jgi:hypothetical protein